MNFKRPLVAVAATAGTAALIFGGSTVSTAFTSDSSGSARVNTAHTSKSLQTPTVTLDNAIPGGKGDPATISYTNDGTTKEKLTVKVGPLRGNSDLAGLVHVYIGGTDQGTLTQIENAYGGGIDVGTFAKGQSFSVSIHLELDDSAGNNVQNRHIVMPYTLTATATN